jgi:hypothetical protein
LLDADDGRRPLVEVDRTIDSDGLVDSSEVDGMGPSTLGVELLDLSLVGSEETLLRTSSDGLFAELTTEMTGGRMLSNTIVLSANAFLKCGRVS